MDPHTVEISSFQIGVGAVISLLAGVIGAVGVWYNLKNKVNVLNVKLDAMETEQEHTYTRIENLKKEVGKNKEKHDNNVGDLKKEMSAMELRIIQAIHAIK